jgi:hypothetical protein
MQIAKRKLRISDRRYFAICNLQFAICNSDVRFRIWRLSLRRTGGVYITVLGSALIVSLLGLSALVGQRIQNRIVAATADMRQAQLNANTAVELALLVMKQEANWRINRANGDWFTNRGTSAGTCSLNVTDPIDGDLANNAGDPVVVLGIGYRGQAEQRVKLTVDSQLQPISSLRSALAAGDLIDLASDTLRTGGLISGNTVTAVTSQVYGSVEGVTVSGSTYNGTTTQVNAGSLPTMPTWASVFDYYRNNGTQIDMGSLATWSTINLGRNVGFENTVNSADWTGTPPAVPTADISQSTNWKNSGTYSLRVTNRADWFAGAAQRIDGYVKPGQQYYVECWVNVSSLLSARNFHVTLYTKGTGDVLPSFNVGPSASVLSVLGIGVPAQISGTVTAPPWTGQLEYAFVKIGGADIGNTGEFYMDDFVIRETTPGRIIYQKVLSPNVNSLYAGAPTNAAEGKSHGIYWVNCNGIRLTIERSRILGTLLVVNPGPGSCVADGPISWSPAVAGYPALLVDADNAADADFAINATNRALSETQNGVNFNPSGAAHPQLGQDADLNDVYQSRINGLIAIEDDLRFQNRPLVRGQILVGDDVSNSSGELEIEFRPDSLLSPPPGFQGPYSYQRRAGSTLKAVLP